MFWTVTQVALGGAIGAACRYLAGLGVLRLIGATSFPVAILGINVFGSFLMGFSVVVMEQRSLMQGSPFVITGLLGGFTTFSTFSLETMALIERGVFVQAGLYVGLSVGLSVAGLILGMMIARGVLS